MTAQFLLTLRICVLAITRKQFWCFKICQNFLSPSVNYFWQREAFSIRLAEHTQRRTTVCLKDCYISTKLHGVTLKLVIYPENRPWLICRLFTSECRVPFHASPPAIYGGQSIIATGFSPSISVSPSQYHSTFISHWHYMILSVDIVINVGRDSSVGITVRCEL